MSIRYLKSVLMRTEISRPVFIIGCGRSGTTSLGNSLAVHRGITYLNEPRELWRRVYPETDIWTNQASARGGKLVLTAGDTDERRSRMLRRSFHMETAKTGKPLLVEKLPINNFRLTFIHSIFPDARFIFLFRNGLEVARSIEKLDRETCWFGANDYKWKQLVAYSKASEQTSGLPESCDRAYLKGLLEWRHASECAVDFLATLPEDRLFELSYREFTEAHAEVLERLITFLGVGIHPALARRARDTVSRRAECLDGRVLSERERAIGGRLLPLSMDSTCRSLMRREPATGSR